MIPRSDLQVRAREWGLQERVVEKDYVIGWLLWGISRSPKLQQHWAFKGGTCLKKCYLETYRFSEDLDFTVLEDGPLQPEDVAPILERVLEAVAQESGIEFPTRFTLKAKERSVEGRIYYRGPVGMRQPEKIKLDLTSLERVVRPTVLRPIAHAFPDALPPPAEVRCYGFEEVFAEKIRALAERCRPRDLYDVVNLFRRRDLVSAPDLIRSVLDEKCEFKSIPRPTAQSLAESPFRQELEAEWSNMLAHQLPLLPEIGPFWEELGGLFSWLEGEPVAEILQSVPARAGEFAWVPPPTVYVWGTSVPLEPVRFAAANRLCVELGYGGSRRVIEPYSLRQSREGALLLYAVKADTGEIRCYRVDRIQSARVLHQVFRPRYRVELSQSGPLAVPRIERPTATPTAATRPPSSYAVECPRCGRQFPRATSSTTLRPHKDPGGGDCPGRTGRRVRV